MANYGCKIRVYIPKGCEFNPHRAQIDESNIEKRTYDLTNLWETLLDPLDEPDASNYLHLVEHDIFARQKRHLVISFWHDLITTLVPWKEQHKGFNMVFVSDEFQQLTTTRFRGRSKQKGKSEMAEEITDAVIDGFRKNGIRLIAAFNPLKSVDEFLRPQFTYFMFKYMTEDDHTDWTREVASWTEHCRRDEIILFFNRAPEDAPDVDQPLRFDRVFWPLRFDISKRLHVGVKVPKDFFLRPTLEEDVSEKYRIHARRLAYGLRVLNTKGVAAFCPDRSCIYHSKGFLQKLTYADEARLFKWTGPSNVRMHITNHPWKEEEFEETQEEEESTPPPTEAKSALDMLTELESGKPEAQSREQSEAKSTSANLTQKQKPIQLAREAMDAFAET